MWTVTHSVQPKCAHWINHYDGDKKAHMRSPSASPLLGWQFSRRKRSEHGIDPRSTGASCSWPHACTCSLLDDFELFPRIVRLVHGSSAVNTAKHPHLQRTRTAPGRLRLAATNVKRAHVIYQKHPALAGIEMPRRTCLGCPRRRSPASCGPGLPSTNSEYITTALVSHSILNTNAATSLYQAPALSTLPVH